VREVYNEIKDRKDRLAEWAHRSQDFFQIPTEDEMQFVAQIFRFSHFQAMIREKERLQGKPVADPFVIAYAGCHNGCVVTQEAHRPNASRIPNVCEHFGIQCICLEEFMKKENWTF